MTLARPQVCERPRASDFELGHLSLVVFGPGHGEAQVLILPDGTLGVIDGCREPRNGDSNGLGDPVREFLEDWHDSYHRTHCTGRLRFVALTHPHEDHYAGLGRLIRAYEGDLAEVWCTFPTGGRYASAFLEYEQLTSDNPDQIPDLADYKGLTRVHAAVKERGRDLQVLQRGKFPMLLLEEVHAGTELRIECIAPSGADLMLAQDDLVAALSTASETGERPRVRHDPNLTSAALLVTWGASRILLGGDLLCAQGDYEGWRCASGNLTGPVQVVKVAHHASEGAQDWELWARLQTQLAIVTPFKEATERYPPQREVLQRIVGHSTKLALTSPPRWLSADRRVISRNAALSVTASPPQNPNAVDAVGVSLDADGTITRVVLSGRAAYYP